MLIGEHGTSPHTDGCILSTRLQRGLEQADGWHGLNVLARNELCAEALHKPLLQTVDMVDNLLRLADHGHQHHLGDGIHLGEVDRLRRQLLQHLHRLLDPFLKLYIHILL